MTEPLSDRRGRRRARLSWLSWALALCLLAAPACSDDGPDTGTIGADVVDALVADVDPCPDGAYCDDGDPCTLGDRCEDHVCKPGAQSLCECKTTADCATKEDDDLCNGTLFCDTSTVLPWLCKVNPTTQVTCKVDDAACQAAVCDPKTGACTSTDVEDGALCDDDNPCTVAGACKGGACAVGPNTCSCASDADCAIKEDGDLCNGTLYCDTKSAKCAVNPASVIACSAQSDTPCQSNQCDPASGACGMVPALGGTGCDDEDACTKGDFCQLGKCISGTNTCLCTTDADCEQAKGDGNLCNGTKFCNKVNGLCEDNPATVVSCPSVLDTACRKNTCVNVFEEKDGVKLAVAASCVMVNEPDNTVCDDSNVCSAGDVCTAGSCAGPTDTCKCKKDSDCASEEDGNQCNGVLYCDKQVGACKLNDATKVSCPDVDNTQCRKNLCQPKTGKCALVDEPLGTNCDDGSACTKNDVCDGGACVGKTWICECKGDADCAAKDDGDKCNGVPFCNKQGSCEANPASVVLCAKDSDTACLKNTCDAKTGACFLAAESTATQCDDGDACTAGDACDGKGGCKSGTSVCECYSTVDCLKKDDGNLCNGVPYCDTSTPGKHLCKPNPSSVVVCPTVNDGVCIKNTCDPKTGACHLAKLATGTTCDDGDSCTKSTSCVDGSCSKGTFVCSCASNADCLAQDDGDLCNGVPYCDTTVPGKHVCKPNPGSAIHCDQGKNTQCLQNRCDPKTGGCGLAPFTSAKSCDDNEPCTVGDACDKGVCKGGAAKDCDDKDACTTDACVKGKGCTHKQENCDDGNTCTVDKCDSKNGKCDFGTKLNDGATCNADNNGCTVNDTCNKGACFAGVQFKCVGTGNACDLSVCQTKGITEFQCITGVKPDGAVCDDASACTIGSTCKKGQCQSTGKERLWVYAATGKADDYYYQDVVAIGAEVVVAGGHHVKGKNQPATSYAHLRRLGVDGTVLSTREFKADQPSLTVGFARVRQLGTGDLIAAGTTRSGGQDQVFVARVAPDVKSQTWARTHKVFSGVLVRGLVVMPDNGAVMTGTASAAGKAFTPLVRVASTGHLLSSVQVASSTVGDIGEDVVALPGGNLLIAGRSGGKTAHGLLQRVDLNGKVLWRQQATLPGATASHMRHVTFTPGVGATVVGAQTVSGKQRSFIGRYDLAGLRSRYRMSPGQADPLGALVLDSGKVLLYGQTANGAGGVDPWASLTDPAGNPIWQQTYDLIMGKGLEGNTAMAGAALRGNGLVFVGTHHRYLKRGLVMSFSGWGHRSCKSAGGCGGVGPDHCDDGKPCSLDLCVDKTGKCQSTNLDGLVCDPQDGCTVHAECDKGACKADPNGLKWARSYDKWHKGGSHWNKYAGVYRMLGTQDGGTVLMGHHRAANKPDGQSAQEVWLRKVDHTGAVLWQVKRPGSDTFAFRQGNGVYRWPQTVALHEANNGEVWLWGWTGNNGNSAKGFIERWDALGGYLGKTSQTVTAGSSTLGVTALMQRDDGDVITFNQQVFTRRKADLSVSAKSTPSSYHGAISHLAAAGGGQTWAVGRGGSPLWISLHAANGSVERARQVKEIQDGPLGVAVSDKGQLYIPTWRDASGQKRLRVQVFDSKTLAHKAQVAVDQTVESTHVQVAPAPGGGWAWLTSSGGKDLFNRIRLTTVGGRNRFARDLSFTKQGLLQAMAVGADGQSLTYAGYDVSNDGVKRTHVYKTGPWLLAPCSAAGKCAAKSLADCSDGDACTWDFCDPDKGCHHKTIDCNDGSACTTDTCDKKTGCTNTPVVCKDDGLACTTTVCQPIKQTVLLQQSSGAYAEYFFEKAGCNHRLVQACIDGDRCTLNGCDGTGCTSKKAICDDNNPCTQDTCNQGGTPFHCSHTPVVCNDNEPCTIDACLKTNGCTYVPAADGVKCEDGEVCKLGPGKCSGSKCVVAPPGVVSGCHSSLPATTCLQTKASAKGKLDAFIGKVWLDEDGDGKNPTLATCDMKAGGFKLAYANGTNRADAQWSGMTATSCSVPATKGGKGVYSPSRFIFFKKYNSGAPGPVRVGLVKLKVPGKHTQVRVRMRFLAGSALYYYLDGRLQIGGKIVLDDKLKSWGMTDFGSVGLLGCSPVKLWNYGYYEKWVDVQMPHTGGDIDVVFSGTPNHKENMSHFIVVRAEVWTK